MITVSEARQLIKENCRNAKVELIPLPSAIGCVLAEATYSIIDTPPFNQSAMDGYAFSFDGWDGKSDLIVTGEIPAGDYSSVMINPAEAVRIYTGAVLPKGADTVVMQEKVLATGHSITIKDEQIFKGAHVRLRGSQAKKGEVALQKGQLITPAAISFLVGTGIDKVKVFTKPSVSIIVTGKELVQPGNPVSEGKIYESNSFGLVAALNQINISPVSVEIVDDDEMEIINTVTDQLKSDIIILTGGVSVGDYDYVATALEKCGVLEIFHKVKQKPGKPFYFGRHDQTLVFALPGNPAAVLTCFYEYVVPAISSFTKKDYFKRLELPLAHDFKKKPGLTFFLKGKTSINDVSILDHQESYQMNSFAIADCLVELEEDKEIYKKGELVNIIMII